MNLPLNETDNSARMEHPSNEYLRSAVMTATPEQLQLMLYDGAIRFTRQGIEGLEKQNFEEVFNGFSRAQKIILELLNGLNYDVDRELCQRMAGLYNFIYRKLVDASVQRDINVAREALALIEYQRETWVMLIEKLREERGGKTPAPAAAEPARPQLVVAGVSDDAEYGSFEG
jgi:flagellar protein FliS